jgi:hypothetical protein
MGLAARRRRERKRQALLQVGKWLLMLSIFAAIGYAAHQAGTALARIEVERLAQRLAVIEQRSGQIDQQNAALRAELDEARAQNRQLQQRYDSDVPRGTAAAVMAAARERLAAGVTADRLQLAIRTAAPVRRCDGPTVSRRFRIGVGARLTEDDSTTFAEGMIRVSALVPAVTDDMARAVVVTFSGLGSGGTRSATGLPASHVFTLDNHELRLTVTESQVRGFATATLTSCRIG